VVGLSTGASKTQQSFAGVIVSNRCLFLVSCLLHIESPEPLFKRIFAMGGTPLLVKPLSFEVTESTYAAAIEKLRFQIMTVEERAKALKQVVVEDLLVARSNLPMLPVIDGELITVRGTFSQWSFKEKLLPGTKWCESIMIGDCEMDGSLDHHQSFLH